MKQIQTFKTKRSSSIGMDTCTVVSRSSRCCLDVDDLLARIDSALREQRIR